jgi:hypothetical protein
MSASYQQSSHAALVACTTLHDASSGALNLPIFVSAQPQNVYPLHNHRQLSSLKHSHDRPNPTNSSSSNSTSHGPKYSSFPFRNNHPLETTPTHTNDISDHKNTASATSVPTVPSSPPLVHHMVTCSKNLITKPILLPDGKTKYPLPRALTVSTDLQDTEPTCYSSAVKHAVWRDTMANEFNALLKNGNPCLSITIYEHCRFRMGIPYILRER